MATLRVRTATDEHRLDVAPGQSVRDALDTTEWRVRAACGGTGQCGACLVRLIEGEVTPATVAEYLKLTPEERATGTRLACQMRLKGDACVQLDLPAPPSPWKSLPEADLIPSPGRLPELEKFIYGVAVDLGTSHIRVTLWDRKQGRRIASRRGPNPQGGFGADVLNRLDAAVAADHADALATLARDAIVAAVRDILARDVGEVSPMLAEIGAVVVVANTAMLALLTGSGAETLLDSGHWQAAIDCRPRDPAAWRAGWHMANAHFVMPEPVAGFVGSDLLADLIATDLTGGPAGALLLDLGTNTEIALWDGHALHVTAVPGGPAFEAVGLRHGMAAEAGAIHRVRGDGNGGYGLDVIGGGEARGFCGSGLVDAIAALLANGVLKPSGRFAVAPGPEGHALDPANPLGAIVAGDVDAFQRAKAATAAAMRVLLDRAGIGWRDLNRLCVCGAFGRHLDIGHAQTVGLLPAIAPERIELHADAALAGAEIALLCPERLAGIAALRPILNLLNMSLVIDFDDIFIDHLRLRPLPP